MGYVIVVVASAVVGAFTYVVTLRRSMQPDTHSFDPPDADPESEPRRAPQRREPAEHQSRAVELSEPVGASDVRYIPVGAGVRLSWRSRSVSLLGLIALVMVVSTAIAVSLYQFGGMLIRFVVHKLQTS